MEELEKIQKELKTLDNEVNQKFKLIGELREKEESLKVQSIVESGILSEINWKIRIGRREIIYLCPQSDNINEYDGWVKKLELIWKSGFNHYRIPLDRVDIFVNDKEVHLESSEGSTIPEIIREFGLNVVSSEIEENILKLEENLKKMKELDSFLRG